MLPLQGTANHWHRRRLCLTSPFNFLKILFGLKDDILLYTFQFLTLVNIARLDSALASGILRPRFLEIIKQLRFENQTEYLEVAAAKWVLKRSISLQSVHLSLLEGDCWSESSNILLTVPEVRVSCHNRIRNLGGFTDGLRHNWQRITKSLNFQMCLLTSENVCAILQYCPFIEKLDLCNAVSVRSRGLLSPNTCKLSQLRFLNVSGCMHIEENDLAEFCASQQHLEVLKCNDLRHGPNVIGYDAAAAHQYEGYSLLIWSLTRVRGLV